MLKFLSKHFSVQELIVSETAARKGIDNTPSPQAMNNLRRVTAFLEHVRDLLNDAPILISSEYRCPELNELIGSTQKTAPICMDLRLISPPQISVPCIRSPANATVLSR